MTVTLKVKNSGGPYTVDIHRVENEHKQKLCTLKPGEEYDVTCWKGNKLEIQEIDE